MCKERRDLILDELDRAISIFGVNKLNKGLKEKRVNMLWKLSKDTGHYELVSEVKPIGIIKSWMNKVTKWNN